MDQPDLSALGLVQTAGELDEFSQAFADRRRDMPRVPLVVNVDLRSDNNLFIGASSDVSTGGVFVATATLLPIGAEVEVTLALPDSPTFAALAEVRWRREVGRGAGDEQRGMGLKFQGLSDEARAAIERFVQARDPLFYPD